MGKLLAPTTDKMPLLTKTVIGFLKENKFDAIAGFLYSTISYGMFFYSLGYGASCPDVVPCNPIIDAMLSVLYPLTVANTISWELLVFFVARLFALVADASGYIAMLIEGSITSAIWIFIGTVGQKIFNDIIGSLSQRAK
ncbi:MAG: hypothetical protein HYX24_02450 [Candidatus Aenigmarchaeota archaeon]|nr:hypothetical protein [Candidatus Aenigmarchaeota archaeon]